MLYTYRSTCIGGTLWRALSLTAYGTIGARLRDVIADLAIMGIAAVVVLWMYFVHGSRSQAEAAHTIRNRFATLGNRVALLERATDREELKGYLYLVDKWIDFFLDLRRGRRTVQECPYKTLLEANFVRKIWAMNDGGRTSLSLECERTVCVAVSDVVVVLMLEVLLDNAQKYARRRVRVTVAEDESTCWVSIEEDGHGIGLWNRARIRAGVCRGHGLRILSREVSMQEGATFEVSRSELGGACMRLGLPRVERQG